MSLLRSKLDTDPNAVTSVLLEGFADTNMAVLFGMSLAGWLYLAKEFYVRHEAEARKKTG